MVKFEVMVVLLRYTRGFPARCGGKFSGNVMRRNKKKVMSMNIEWHIEAQTALVYQNS
jgi:hypothetical protein